jgi:hypothetical protein
MTFQKPPPRDPGPDIKAALRQEVNFGCPISYPGGGCGSPILTYHHFDPPWAGHFVHNLNGMIALCPEHHGHADGGAWTKVQLQTFKKHPYVNNALKCRWPWTTEKLVMQFGPNLSIGEGSPLWLYERPVLGFRPHDNLNIGNRVIVFDSYIEDHSGNAWLKIENSFFSLELGSTADLEFKPLLRMMQARHKDGTHLEVRYRRVPISGFDEWWAVFNRDKRFSRDARYNPPKKFLSEFDVVDSDGCIPIMSVMGSFVTRHVRAEITKKRAAFQCLMPSYSGPQGYFETPGYIMSASASIRLVEQDSGREFLRLG